MAKAFLIISFLMLAMALKCANSARTLDEVVSQSPVPVDTPDLPDPTEDAEAAPLVAPPTTNPSGQIPATDDDTASVPVTGPVPTNVAAPVATPVTTGSSGGAAAVAGAEPLSFFMHDILGGSHPSGRAVTGIVANSDANGLPFSKPNNQVFPINGGVPITNINGIVNNNNAPLLVGLNGSPTNTVLQNSGNNNVVSNSNNQPFVTAGQLPAGLTLQKVMFGSITVVDNELTEGHELGSGVMGQAQGFYLASSLDGTSHTLVLTAIFHGGNHNHEIEDTISFFGVHRTATPESQLAVVGGTGKYENAKGYATIERLHQEDQHITDGVETITHFTVYISP